MAFSFSGIPILRTSATDSRTTPTTTDERVSILSRSAPDCSKKPIVETNLVPVIAALDDDKKLVTRQATAEETLELKASKTNKGKTKQVIQAIEQVFIPEE